MFELGAKKAGSTGLGAWMVRPKGMGREGLSCFGLQFDQNAFREGEAFPFLKGQSKIIAFT